MGTCILLAELLVKWILLHYSVHMWFFWEKEQITRTTGFQLFQCYWHVNDSGPDHFVSSTGEENSDCLKSQPVER